MYWCASEMLDIFRRIFKREAKYGKTTRLFKAGITDRLTSSWGSNNAPINEILRTYLSTVRHRSFEQYLNNGYAKRAVALFRTNVIGKSGIRLQCRFRKGGVILRDLNSEIERWFERWSEHQNCDISKSMSWVEIQQLVMLQVVRDGEAIIRMIDGAKNRFGFALQVIEADLLDVEMNRLKTSFDNKIELGIELDDWNAPVAYYFKQKTDQVKTEHLKIPASEILHIFIKEKPDQRRGIPWLHAGLRELHMLNGYSEAELTAARAGAAKMGFFTQSGVGRYSGEEDDEGRLIRRAEPGSFETLPAGVDFKPFDPQHPSGNFQPFMKTMLRGIACGLGVSYTSLASDLEAVNFSSIRSSLIEERDVYMLIQDWLIEHLCQPVYRKWLKMAVMQGILKIPMTQFEEFDSPTWLPRRWAWVDPLKDVKANIEAVNAHLKSRQEVCAEQGRDFEDVMVEKAQEEMIAEENGIELDVEEINGNGITQGVGEEDSISLN